MKVIEFKQEPQDVLELIEELKGEVEKNGIDNLIFTCVTKDGDYLTGFSRKVANDYGLMHSLVGNMQAVALRKQIVEGFDND